MMPDLPGVGWERDIECFREFFENPDFRTDGLKLYPTLVIRGTAYDMPYDIYDDDLNVLTSQWPFFRSSAVDWE